MARISATDLARRRCLPCEGGVSRLTAPEVEVMLRRLGGWRLTHNGERIRKDWVVRDFMAGVEFLRRVADLAEDQGHHPDLHLESYREVWIEIWTHALGGLSENDLILAAQVDTLPIRLKTPRPRKAR
jgi:4a-hydroxytetrahydrobiopterin dehydratase